jgi:hypothetical protein
VRFFFTLCPIDKRGKGCNNVLQDHKEGLNIEPHHWSSEEIGRAGLLEENPKPVSNSLKDWELSAKACFVKKKKKTKLALSSENSVTQLCKVILVTRFGFDFQGFHLHLLCWESLRQEEDWSMYSTTKFVLSPVELK